MARTSSTADLARQSLVGFKLLLIMIVILGIGYPLAVWGVGQVTMQDKASGQLISIAGQDVGSRLIGQNFAVVDDDLFHGRPSAADYDALASGPSNLGPSNPELLALIEKRQQSIATVEGVAPSAIPADAVTASASGLDPYVSPEYAALQAARIAKARGLEIDKVQTLIADSTTGRQFGFLGQPKVNVLELNLSLPQG